mmetsp:Transcript_125574/g.268017  ORF Transcript_125574/g.268017 Transcript_125574/m.268017 type:complete len:265 (+) Transcript_125574:63-857(+)
MVVEGYWGAPTATIDWCESNYTVTPWLAEFFNSTSSFFIVAAGFLPLALHRDLWGRVEPRFALVFASVCVVGLGSVAFHGTLLFRHQMLDEVPMLWTVVVILYTLLEQYQRKPRYGVALPLGLAAYAALGSCATSQQGGNAQWFSFHTFFAGCELPCLFLVYRFFSGLDQSEMKLRSVLRKGFVAYLLAIIVWLSDLNFCGALQRLPGYDFWNLHAFGWHLLTSYGLYSMILGMWYHRLRCVLGEKVSLNCDGVLPRLRCERAA